MLRHLLNSLLALTLAVTPVAAQEFNINLAGGRPPPSKATLFRSTACAFDATNTNNYQGMALTFTGVDETWPVYVILISMARDALTTFGVSQVNDGQAVFTEVTDQDGTGLVDTEIARSPTKLTGQASRSYATVWSEGVSNSHLCGWVVAGLNDIVVDSSVSDDDTASGALVLTTGTTNANGFVMGGCINDTTGQTTTWAVITERIDTCSAEACYSMADAAGTGSSMSNTCDYSGTADASGSAIAVH